MQFGNSLSRRQGSVNDQTLSRVSVSLSQLKKSTLKTPFIKHHVHCSEHQIQAKQIKPKGMVKMGLVAKPAFILNKQERKNPFHGSIAVTQKLLNKKGLLQLMSMGVIGKQADCYQLLNLRYDVEEKKTEVNPTFLTNPTIFINAYYESRKHEEKEEVPRKATPTEERKESRQRSTKIRSSKKKVIKKEEPLLILRQRVALVVLNSQFQKNEAYLSFLKDLRKDGKEVVFRLFAAKVENFAKKYGLKKFTIVPEINQTKRLTETDILNCIPNAGILGIRRKVKGNRWDLLANLVARKVQAIRFKHLKLTADSIEKQKSNLSRENYQ